MLSYELTDKEIWDDGIDEDENSQNNDNLMLETPILFANNANISYSELELDLELKEKRKKKNRECSKGSYTSRGRCDSLALWIKRRRT